VSSSRRARRDTTTFRPFGSAEDRGILDPVAVDLGERAERPHAEDLHHESALVHAGDAPFHRHAAGGGLEQGRDVRRRGAGAPAAGAQRQAQATVRLHDRGVDLVPHVLRQVPLRVPNLLEVQERLLTTAELDERPLLADLHDLPVEAHALARP
jgi:hypothetical protein